MNRRTGTMAPKRRRTSATTILLVPLVVSVFLFYVSIKYTQQTPLQDEPNDTATMVSVSAAKVKKDNPKPSVAKVAAAPPTEEAGKKNPIKASTATTKITAEVDIPPCDRAPWKPSESLVGPCPGSSKPFKSATSIDQCATECCNSDACISWQFRADTGCLHGGDVRLGMEKDAVTAWCSDHPPKRWNGQYVVKRANGKITHDRDATGACSLDTWNPNEQPGQCFGLGDVKKNDNASDSAQKCMEACCRDTKCGAWQFQSDLGCFYHERMHNCQNSSDPTVFEPFVGRRKLQSNRKYIDIKGKPWSQKLN